MKRRQFIQLVGAVAAYAAVPSLVTGRVAVNEEELEHLRHNWRQWLPEGADLALDLTPVELSAAQWKQRLTPEQYDVLRREGTERPFSHRYNELKEEGVFLCAGCSLPLFTSAMKFDSGTGWPSFFTSIPDHLETRRDFKLIWPRIEYHCARCGGHQGHVFDDGPPPTGERWCNNGVALEFLPRSR